MKGQAQEERSTDLKGLMSCWTWGGKENGEEAESRGPGRDTSSRAECAFDHEVYPKTLGQNSMNGSQSKLKKLKKAVKNLHSGNAQDRE